MTWPLEILQLKQVKLIVDAQTKAQGIFYNGLLLHQEVKSERLSMEL